MKKQIIVIISLLLVIIAGTAGIFGYIYNNTKNWTNLVFPGVKIEGEDLSGKTEQEAAEIIKQKYGDAILKKNITIKTADKTYSLDYSKLNARYNIDEVVKEAFDYGKNVNMFEKYKLIKNPVSKQFDLKFIYDPKPVKDLVATIKKEVEKQPQDASIKLVNGSFQITPDKKGVKLLDDKLQSDILSKINGDINATSINEDAPLEQVSANITKDKLQEINTKISSFTTNFSTSSFDRSTNITLATESINGTLLMPGQTFSFNGRVGERTAARGYMEAPVIIGNKVDSGFGGGICQVSTTLYNAVIRANVKSVERVHHTLPSHYIGLGMDATVDWGNIDYKFTNTFTYPIYIEGVIQNKNINFNIYSDSSLTKIKYDLQNDVYATIKPGVKYVNDPTLPEGQTVQDQPPSTGYKVRVYKNAYQNGTLIAHELISDDYYKPVDQVIKKGTKTN